MSKEIEIYTSFVTSNLKFKKNTQSMKFMMEAKKLPFTEIDISSDEDKKKYMFETSGKREFPQLYADGKFIGCWDEVEYFNEIGELDGKLK
ncbi:sh3 domain-binding glutamic acid-rich protein [Anaeramoeba flamelloides]|uniref:Sh3 domain-binding glutamic acid-rich protein n=1 Tax=Anaeramoeba flamelloides TaxID=1746091 RepID=A0AAV7YCW3_9EUKA|nr:sh3 domain-binding glutamic acid-rich protein [Anaeramoeba flamelloides]KAJ6235142.1 sh3 domain-binding glutamic acid-rich protein [Anaeramoeba flamelloides]